jgi:hypothetical protein
VASIHEVVWNAAGTPDDGVLLAMRPWSPEAEAVITREGQPLAEYMICISTEALGLCDLRSPA